MKNVIMMLKMMVNADRLTKTRSASVGKQGGETGDAESKRAYVREQGKTTPTTAEELKKMETMRT